ncbi:hypothetical protein [Pelagibacterium sediminicola]|uniref:hypothetical protein n=1 Tax=Pelagibacterium sediminicola TaxID=2248761 RepID=UPI0013001FC3|nr:hypothetical protein [Pelagibacterium sediminicola]
METKFTPRFAAGIIKCIRRGEPAAKVAQSVGMTLAELDQAFADVGFRLQGNDVVHDFGGGIGTLHRRANFVDATERCISGHEIFGARS